MAKELKRSIEAKLTKIAANANTVNPLECSGEVHRMHSEFRCERE